MQQYIVPFYNSYTSRIEKQHKSTVRLRIPELKLISYPTLDSLIILLVTTSLFIYIHHKMHEEIR